MKFTQIPVDTFEKLQLNAGILVDSFTPDDETIGKILGSTSGGVNFVATPTFEDYGEDIDNCPKNMMELKKLTAWEATMAGTFKSVDATLAKDLVGAADIDSEDETHIVPRQDVLKGDFKEVWWVGDYSDVNTGEDAGYMAIHLKNALSTGGFSIQSNDKGKGDMAFTFTGHYSMASQDEPPFEIYIRKGEEATSGGSSDPSTP